MATGHIDLVLDVPDFNLTGTGEFDVTAYFQKLFVENSLLKDEISDKIVEIFKGIKVRDITDDWTKKIKEAFSIKKGSIDIEEELQKKATDVIKKLKIDTEGLTIRREEVELPKSKKTTRKADEKEQTVSKKPEGVKDRLKDDKNFDLYTKFISSNTFYHDYLKLHSYKIYQDFLRFHTSKLYQDFLKFQTGKTYENFMKDFSSNTTALKKSLDGLQNSKLGKVKEVGKEIEKKGAETGGIETVLKKSNLDLVKTIGTEIQSKKAETEKKPEQAEAKVTTPIEPVSVSQESQGTAFKVVNEVSVADFTKDALDKLASLFNIDTSKKKGPTKSKDGEEDQDKSKGGGFLSTLLGTGIGGALGQLLGGGLLKGAPSFLKGLVGPAALAAGLVWMAIDGIRGFFAADKWGVSKISGALGGALGGMDSGLKGAMKGMGKWALIGAGIGSIFPVVGTIVGGLIGAAIGAVLGFIGGEKLAKAFDAIGGWLKKHLLEPLENLGKWFMAEVVPFFKALYEDGLNWLKEVLIPKLEKLFKSLKPVFEALGVVFDWIVKGVSWLIKEILWPISKVLIGGIWDTLKWVIGVVIDAVTMIVDAFVWVGEGLGWLAAKLVEGWEWLVGKWDSFKAGFIKFGEMIGEGAAIIFGWLEEKWNAVKQVFIDFGTTVSNTMSKAWTMIKNAFTHPIDTFVGFFKKIFGWIGGLGGKIWDKVKSVLPNWVLKWFGKGKTAEDATAQAESEKNAQAEKVNDWRGKADAIITKQGIKIPSKDDIVTATKQTDTSTIRTEGYFDKTLQALNTAGNFLKDVDKNIEKLNDAMNKSIGVLNTHTEIFLQLVGNGQQQLKILPALIPAAPSTDVLPPPEDSRDKIFSYREDRRYDLVRGRV